MNAEPGWRCAWVARLNWLEIVAATADHRAHRAIDGHGHQRTLADRVFGAVVGDRAGDGGFPRCLHARVEGGDDGQVAAVRTDKISQLGGDPVGEIAVPRPRNGDRPKRAFLPVCRRGPALFDKTGFDHVGEHLGGARRGQLAVAGRVEPRRRLQEARDHRALVEIEPPRRDPEIAVRGGVNAVGAGAQIDPVQIDFEDLVLGEPMFEPQCQQGFADFAREAPLGCQEQVLCQLLGDRAAAFDDAAGGEIGQRRARQPDRVDAEMAVKPAVLGRDDRLGQIGRHLLQGQRLAEQIAVSREQTAVGGEDRDARAPLRLRQLAGVGQGQREIAGDTAAADRRPQQQ